MIYSFTTNNTEMVVEILQDFRAKAKIFLNFFFFPNEGEFFKRVCVYKKKPIYFLLEIRS